MFFALNIFKMVSIVLFIFTLFQLCLVPILSQTCQNFAPHTAQKPTADYYWREYVGIIPDDALQGGTDKAGNPTYVGQAYIRNFELLPVIIYPGCRFANTTAYANEILCAKNLEKFQWVVTKHDETHLLTSSHLVIGGSEVGHSLNIGRVSHDGRIVIGKVFSYPLPNSGLWVPYNGSPLRFLSYEILTYNFQNKMETGQVWDINVRFNNKCIDCPNAQK